MFLCIAVMCAITKYWGEEKEVTLTGGKPWFLRKNRKKVETNLLILLFFGGKKLFLFVYIHKHTHTHIYISDIIFSNDISQPTFSYARWSCHFAIKRWSLVTTAAWQNDTVSPLRYTPSRTSTTRQRCFYQTYEDANELHVPVHLKVGGLEQTEEEGPGE